MDPHPDRPAGRVAHVVAAGFAAATVMTATTMVQQAVLRAVAPDRRPVDYDASHHVGDAVGSVLDRPPRTPVERGAYFALAHWGYGSAVALAYEPMRARTDDVRAGVGFLVLCEAMALVLLPGLGGAPPPHRWTPGALATSLGQHAVYTVALVTTRRALLRRGRGA